MIAYEAVESLERNVRSLSERTLLYMAATTHDPIVLLTVLDELRCRQSGYTDCTKPKENITTND